MKIQNNNVLILDIAIITKKNKLEHVQPIKHEPSFPQINDNQTERLSCPQTAPELHPYCNRVTPNLGAAKNAEYIILFMKYLEIS